MSAKSDHTLHYDVLVVGSGNAACSAAHAAIEKKARVGIIEKASKGNRGGNSALTGHMRFVFHGIEDIQNLVDGVQLKAKIQDTANTDYQFRVVVDQEQYLAVMQHLTSLVDYSNFKSMIHDQPSQGKKNALYGKIWSLYNDLCGRWSKTRA